MGSADGWGWIKFEKSLEADIRVSRMAERILATDQVTHMRYKERAAVTLVLGGLARLWFHADTFARDDDSIDLSPEEVDKLTGIEGFSKILPRDWFEIFDSDRVKLPGFQEHNGSIAKRKALTAKRVSKHRAVHANAAALHDPQSRNADALPDQTRQDPLKTPLPPHSGGSSSSRNGSGNGTRAAGTNPRAVAKASREQRAWGGLATRAAKIGFRPPLPDESAGVYETQLRLAEREKGIYS